MIGLRVLETKLNYLMCMDIAGLDKFDFHDLSRKLSNKYVSCGRKNGDIIMKDLLDKLSSYNIFNNLLPGIVFVAFAEMFLGRSFVQENLVVGVFLYYFIGLVIGRIGSLVFEPLLKKASFLKFADYKDFVAASKTDAKLEVLSEVNNMYRTFVALFATLLIARLYEAVETVLPVLKQVSSFLAVIAVTALFLISYRKQTSYITKRVEANKEVNP